MLKIKRLNHGGIMACYRCTAACRHCLYASSPGREAGYISAKTSQNVAMLLRKGGCNSVHIGGGEPFINFEGLLQLITALSQQGVYVEYIETNGYFARDENKTIHYLDTLLQHGIDTLCISVDPFHAEYVPTALPIKLAKLCDSRGMGYFLWKQHYIKSLSAVDTTKAHSRKTLADTLTDDYIAKTANSYGITFGGRAVNIEEEYAQKRPLEQILNDNPCRSLLSTDHYHIDMHGKFVPPGCTGFAVDLKQMLDGTDPTDYTVMQALLNGGVNALYRLALKEGITPAEQYTSSCNLCFDLRSKLAKTAKFPELYAEHYTASREYY